MEVLALMRTKSEGQRRHVEKVKRVKFLSQHYSQQSWHESQHLHQVFKLLTSLESVETS
jgi:hypothetical protein